MNILTFDIEDWYNHDDYSQDFEWDKFEVRLYEGVDKILEALDRRHLRGTFFCLGWVAEKHPAIIRRIADGGSVVIPTSINSQPVLLPHNSNRTQAKRKNCLKTSQDEK